MLPIEFTHRPVLDDALVLRPPLVHAFHAGIVETGAIGAGIDGHHLDPVRLQLVVHRRADTLYRVFGRSVGTVERHLDQPRDR